MSLRACMFVARAESGGERAAIFARAERLARFYEPTGLHGLATTELPELGLVCGRIGSGPDLVDSLLWGAPFGAAKAGRDQVLGEDTALRVSLVGFGAAAAWRTDAARIVTAPAGPCSLYCASGPAATSWASHAVAAGYLARGHCEVDRSAIPELAGYDFVGGTRTLVEGVSSVPAATCVDIDPAGAVTRSFWPPGDRWQPVAEGDAYEHTAAALLDSLEHRAGAGRTVALALTAGADSRVLAVALAELGVATSAFVWGDDRWPDVDGARAVAERLGMPFSRTSEWRSDEELPKRFDADTRWADGVLILSPSERTWPSGVDAVLLGAAGEVGRAFYYASAASSGHADSAEGLAEAMRPRTKLRGASADAGERARAAAASWLAAARESGLTSWRLLDVVYAEQRVARWGRAQMPPLESDVLAGFASQDVLRGLVSLPLAERLADGFHRRFVAERRPELALDAPSPPTRRSFARRLLARLRPAGNPYAVSIWDERPATRAWIADDVLRGDLIPDVMGGEWAEATRAGFLNGEPRAVKRAASVCGPVALSAALAELAADQR